MKRKMVEMSAGVAERMAVGGGVGMGQLWTDPREVVVVVRSGMADKVKAELFLAELNRLRKDLGEDKSDLEWVTLHHAFCFISYKMGEFQKYVDEQAAKGEFDELES
jgi:hypothetical protein